MLAMSWFSYQTLVFYTASRPLLFSFPGGKPTLRTFEMVSLYLQGWADEEELLRTSKNAQASRRLIPLLASSDGLLYAARRDLARPGTRLFSHRSRAINGADVRPALTLSNP